MAKRKKDAADKWLDAVYLFDRQNPLTFADNPPGSTLDQVLDGEKRGAAPPPPNYREGSDLRHCGNCKMYDDGRCWGYGNVPVDSDHVCDSWASDPARRAESWRAYGRYRGWRR